MPRFKRLYPKPETRCVP